MNDIIQQEQPHLIFLQEFTPNIDQDLFGTGKPHDFRLRFFQKSFQDHGLAVFLQENENRFAVERIDPLINIHADQRSLIFNVKQGSTIICRLANVHLTWGQMLNGSDLRLNKAAVLKKAYDSYSRLFSLLVDESKSVPTLVIGDFNLNQLDARQKASLKALAREYNFQHLKWTRDHDPRTIAPHKQIPFTAASFAGKGETLDHVFYKNLTGANSLRLRIWQNNHDYSAAATAAFFPHLLINWLVNQVKPRTVKNIYAADGLSAELKNKLEKAKEDA